MKHIFVAVSLAAMALATNAQTQPNQSAIQIYGNLDAGIISAKNVGANNGNATMFGNSVMDTSRIGFRGVESLGGGTSAGFQLESQIQTGDGTQGLASSNGAASGVFGRAANVFYQGSFGRIIGGRQLTASYQALSVGDVRGGKNFGSATTVFFLDGSSFGSSTGLGNLTGSSFVSNSFRYDTPTFNGVRGVVQRAFGGVAGDGVAGDLNASTSTILAAHYDKGPWNLASTYRSGTNSTGVTTSQLYSLGGKYRYQKLQVGLGYATIENPNGAGAANTKFDLKMLSAGYDLTPKWTISGGHYILDDKINGANGAKLTSLVGDYALSKRTGMYVGWAQMANSGSSGFSPYGGGAANLNSLSSTQFPSMMRTAGQTQRAIVAGMTHRF
jgi:predicted porin